MKKRNAPKARPRSRMGMLPLDWAQAPTPDEVWPDKVDIRVEGRAAWPDGCSFHGYVCAIAQRSAFKDKPKVGRTYRSEINYGSVKGEVRIDMASGHRADEPRAGEAGITLRLHLNPTRTRALAARRNAEPLDELGLRQFFKPIASAEEVFKEGSCLADPISLDGNDNLFWNAVEAGGTTPAARARARDQFLVLYEARLRDLVGELFTPLPSSNYDAGEPASGPPIAHASFSWDDLRVTYAEMYAERSAPDPVETMHRLHDRGLSLARAIRASKFSGGQAACAFESQEGFTHVVVPLTRRANFDLSVYAKTPQRIRFEVKYKREFSHIVRKASADHLRLSSALGLLVRDAASRIPWSALRGAAEHPSHAGRNEIIDLMIALQSATRHEPAAFPSLVQGLIRTGGVYDDEGKVPGIGKVIASLVRAGVLEHWRTQKKEARKGRRYGLTRRFFDARLKVLTGFTPPEPVEDVAVAPADWEPSRRARSATVRRYATDQSLTERMRVIYRRNGIEF